MAIGELVLENPDMPCHPVHVDGVGDIAPIKLGPYPVDQGLVGPRPGLIGKQIYGELAVAEYKNGALMLLLCLGLMPSKQIKSHAHSPNFSNIIGPFPVLPEDPRVGHQGAVEVRGLGPNLVVASKPVT